MTNSYVQFGETFDFDGEKWRLTRLGQLTDQAECVVADHHDTLPQLFDSNGRLVNTEWTSEQNATLMRCIRREGEFAPGNFASGTSDHEINRALEKMMSDAPGPRTHRTPEKYLPKTPIAKLGKLVEECGEVLAAAGKTLRWGHASTNPDLPPNEQETNADWLRRELLDLEEAIVFAREALDELEAK